MFLQFDVSFQNDVDFWLLETASVAEPNPPPIVSNHNEIVDSGLIAIEKVKIKIILFVTAY